MKSGKIEVCLVDDHKLFRKGMVELIDNFEKYHVCWEADHGRSFVEKIPSSLAPQIVLLDINMPFMDGFETAQWIRQNLPGVKVLALSMEDDEVSIIKMIRAGACGYILKDADPVDLKNALDAVWLKGYHHSDAVGKALMTNTQSDWTHDKASLLSKNEQEFLVLTASELTYKEIADKMNLSPRTIDSYRETLFDRLGCKSRTGLVLYAIKHKLIKI